jgi:hypothetical protein
MSNNLSRDQKRKAKLAKRAKRETLNEAITPYSGRKYQGDEWAVHVNATETAIYETIKLSKSTLTNKQVKAALISLIEHIRSGNPALLPDDGPELHFTTGSEVDYLVWNIRRHWNFLVEHVGPVHRDDLIGILRTLLYSIEAHAFHSGEQRGYVHFIEGFLKQLM